MHLKKHIKGFFSSNRREKNNTTDQIIITHTKMNTNHQKPANSSKKPNPSNKTLESLFALDSKKSEEEILSSISYCTFTFTFTDPSESPSQQALKQEKLFQILSTLKPLKKTNLSEQVTSALMEMVAANLFRPLPPPPHSSKSTLPASEFDFLSSPDEELQDPGSNHNFAKTWSHLQIVYEILLRLVISSEPKSLSSHFDQTFLENLLALFKSDDPRERESLKNVYHRVYLRFTSLRASMRKSMNEAFLNYVFEPSERHSGVGELLEIWGSIINGFTVPLKEEHKLFLIRVLVPLHKTRGVLGFHRQLSYCVSQFVQKEPVLGGVVVRGVLRYWPVTNCQKEVLLIGELEELVEIVDSDQYRKLAFPLCAQLTRSLNSWNSQVAERALYVWNNEHFVKMLSMSFEEVLPIVVKGLEKNLKWHWSKNVRQLTENVKSMLQEMEPILYSKCLQENDRRESTANQAEIKRKEKWDRIEIEANKNYRLVQQNSHCVH